MNLCKEPRIKSGFIGKEKIRLRKKDFGQVIEYYQNGILTDKFRIIEPNKIIDQELQLMRFDKPSDQKVYKYVDSLIFKVLKYDPNADESNDNDGVTVSYGNPTITIKSKNGHNLNPEPLIVVNGYPLKNKELLRKLLLVETYGITYLTKEKSASLYGSQARNGVIILQTSEKRFKALR